MMPQEAKDSLDKMGVTAPAGLDGRFKIVRSPAKRDLASFVKAVKTLGAWSTAIRDSDRVMVECGYAADELVFKLSKEGGK